jgi:hypothetical protein
MESADLRGPQRCCRAQRSTSPFERISGDWTGPGGDVAGLYLHPDAQRRPSAIAEHGEFACQGRYPYRLGQQITSNRQGVPVRASDSLRRPHRGLRRTDLAARRAGARIPWASPGERHRHLHRLRSRHDDASQARRLLFVADSSAVASPFSVVYQPLTGRFTRSPCSLRGRTGNPGAPGMNDRRRQSAPQNHEHHDLQLEYRIAEFTVAD